jgi:hypothetical protein
MAKRDAAEKAQGSRALAWSRASFAAAVVVLIVGTFASFGGLSYAASHGKRAVHTLAKVTAAHKVVVTHSAAAGQYPRETSAPKAPFKPPKITPASSGPIAATAQASTLPFTGMSLLATVLLSAALLGTGLLLRRAGRRSSP